MNTIKIYQTIPNLHRLNKSQISVKTLLNIRFIASEQFRKQECRLVFIKPEKDNDTICLTNTVSGAVIWEKYVEQSRPKLVGKTEDYISVFFGFVSPSERTCQK